MEDREHKVALLYTEVLYEGLPLDTAGCTVLTVRANRLLCWCSEKVLIRFKQLFGNLGWKNKTAQEEGKVMLLAIVVVVATLH